MEFRNHQVKLGFWLQQLRGNPLGIVVFVLLIPIVLAAMLFVAAVALVGFGALLLSRGLTSLLAPGAGQERRPPAPPASSSGTGGVIDVEVVRKDG